VTPVPPVGAERREGGAFPVTPGRGLLPTRPAAVVVFTTCSPSAPFLAVVPSCEPQELGKRLFVGNLPYSVTEADVRELFEGLGAVEDVKIVLDRETGRSRGFGFVEMGTDSEASGAIEQLNGRSVDGRAITVREAEDRPRGGGGFGGGGGRGFGGGGGGGRGYGGGGGGGGRGGDRPRGRRDSW
jgi:hypothetical protein